MIEQMKDAIAYIDAIPKFRVQNDLNSTITFYNDIGMPAAGIPVIHVAGTNGKGSVCAFLQKILESAGYRVGLFTSPHLVDVRERIRINEAYIPEKDFIEMLNAVQKEVAVCAKENFPCQFEVLYFIAMLYFEKEKPDYIILETGMGGRLDATNACLSPLLCIITRIGLDHTQFLGGTIEKITEEKAGIMKAGTPLLYLSFCDAVSKVIQRKATMLGVDLVPVEQNQILVKRIQNKIIDFSYDTRYYDSSLSLSVRAIYQCENAAIALQAIAYLQQTHKISVTEQQIKDGINYTKWPGRMEEVLPDIYIDGAHNPDGIRAFLDTAAIISKVKTGKKVLLFSVVKDKNYIQMIHEIIKDQIFDQVFLAPISNQRGMKDMQELSELFQEVPSRCFETIENAFLDFQKHAKKNDILFATGSLYLVGEIKAFLNKKEPVK